MRLVSFNTNMFRSKMTLVDAVVDLEADVICMQRVDSQALHLLDKSRYHWHFTPSLPTVPTLSHIGLLTMWRKDLFPMVSDMTFATSSPETEWYQGNTYCRVDFQDHTVINSLVAGYEQDRSCWVSQVNEVMQHAGLDRSIIVGDFHLEDRHPLWHEIARHGHTNHAGHINAFRDQGRHLCSLTKIFARQIDMHSVTHAIDPLPWNEWQDIFTHWPVGATYDL